MNIREHIEAGHYPADNKGRALVPMKGGGFMTVVWTAGYGIWGVPDGTNAPIVWREDGENWGPYHNCRTEDYRKRDLLAPPPRKAKVTRYGVVQRGCFWGSYSDIGSAESWAKDRGGAVVELTGEYEEPWS